MKKRVNISRLKARLSEHLRYVKRGHTIEVLDRVTPVAEITPVEESGVRIRRATESMRTFVRPRPLKTKVDIVALLREDRDSR